MFDTSIIDYKEACLECQAQLFHFLTSPTLVGLSSWLVARVRTNCPSPNRPQRFIVHLRFAGCELDSNWLPRWALHSTDAAGTTE
jgi:hypothetical protein